MKLPENNVQTTQNNMLDNLNGDANLQRANPSIRARRLQCVAEDEVSVTTSGTTSTPRRLSLLSDDDQSLEIEKAASDTEKYLFHSNNYFNRTNETQEDQNSRGRYEVALARSRKAKSWAGNIINSHEMVQQTLTDSSQETMNGYEQRIVKNPPKLREMVPRKWNRQKTWIQMSTV